MDDYLRDFVQESEENITELNNALLELERDPDDDAVMDRVFRQAHTLKGNCGAMGFDDAADLAHAMEDRLDDVRAGRMAVTPELMDHIFEGVDQLEMMVQEVRDHGEPRSRATETIATLRDLGPGEGSFVPPGDDEIEDTLANASDPSDPEHDVYHVRLDVQESESVNNAILVVEALDDAFDLLGTNPSRDALRNGDHDGVVDAAFGSAVGVGAIEAALAPVDEVNEAIIDGVTDRLADAGDAEAAVAADATGDALDASDPADVSAEAAEDMSVDELLGEFEEYDDLDALVEEMDDDGLEAFDDLGEAGSFDDLDIDEADVDVPDPLADADDEPATADASAGGDDLDLASGGGGFGDAGDVDEDFDLASGGGAFGDAADDTAEDDSPADADAGADAGTSADAPADDEEVEDASATFAELKEEVDPVGFDELQDELADLEFDQYDQEDEVGFDELLTEEELEGDDFGGMADADEDEIDAAIDDILVDDAGVADTGAAGASGATADEPATDEPAAADAGVDADAEAADAEEALGFEDAGDDAVAADADAGADAGDADVADAIEFDEGAEDVFGDDDELTFGDEEAISFDEETTGDDAAADPVDFGDFASDAGAEPAAEDPEPAGDDEEGTFADDVFAGSRSSTADAAADADAADASADTDAGAEEAPSADAAPADSLEDGIDFGSGEFADVDDVAFGDDDPADLDLEADADADEAAAADEVPATDADEPESTPAVAPADDPTPVVSEAAEPVVAADAAADEAAADAAADADEASADADPSVVPADDPTAVVSEAADPVFADADDQAADAGPAVTPAANPTPAVTAVPDAEAGDADDAVAGVSTPDSLSVSPSTDPTPAVAPVDDDGRLAPAADGTAVEEDAAVTADLDDEAAVDVGVDVDTSVDFGDEDADVAFADEQVPDVPESDDGTPATAEADATFDEDVADDSFATADGDDDLSTFSEDVGIETDTSVDFGDDDMDVAFADDPEDEPVDAVDADAEEAEASAFGDFSDDLGGEFDDDFEDEFAVDDTAPAVGDDDFADEDDGFDEIRFSDAEPSSADAASEAAGADALSTEVQEADDAYASIEDDSDLDLDRDSSMSRFESRFGDAFADDDGGASASEREATPEPSGPTLPDRDVDLDELLPKPPRQVSEEGDDDEMASVRVDIDQVDRLMNLVEGLVTQRARLRRGVETGESLATIDQELDEVEELTSELQDTVMDIRLVPLRTTANRLPRVVRDIARDQGKEVDFEMAGEDVEIDRTVLDDISDPLMHIVRNAVDHGIEKPADREAKGKEPRGTVTLRAERDRDTVEIVVEDDGRGLDPEGLREEAVDQGVIGEDDAAAMTDDEVYDLVFHSGFSTKEEVTDVSGRGVGMDVVASTVNALDGEVSISSERDEGTTVRMTLPVTVAISDVLFVEAGSEEYGIPLKAVEEIGRMGMVEADDDGSEWLVRENVDEDEDERVPLVRLGEALDAPGPSTDGDGMLVTIRSGVRPVAIHCDDVRGQQEVVVKPFEGVLGDIPGLTGAAVLGEGEVVNILDVNTL